MSKIYSQYDLWDVRMMRVAREVQSWSKDPSTKFGVVIAQRPNGPGTAARIVGTGYNGFPFGIKDDDRLHKREEKYELVIHAEVNAVLNAAASARGGTLYMFGAESAPCRNCTKHVIAAGIKRVIGCGPKIPERWREQCEQSANTLFEAKVKFLTMPLLALAINGDMDGL